MRTFEQALCSVANVMPLSAAARAHDVARAATAFNKTKPGRLDTRRTSSFNLRSSGVPIALIGQEGIRCAAPFRRRSKSGAAPATVGGEPFS